MVKTRFDSLGVAYFGKDNRSSNTYYVAKTAPSGGWKSDLYYSHSDHLGSASLITDGAGHLNQHLAYIPNGEVFVNQRATSFDSRFKFTGKEMDEETGLYYSSQRYLDPKNHGFISSDELREKHPNIGSYVYCAGNPVNLIDPDGRDWYKDKDKSYQYNPALNENNASKILTKGQSYAFRSKTLNDKKGTTNYRKDGSIMFSNVTVGYNRIQKQATEHYKRKKEAGGFVLEKGGFLALPDFLNDETTTKFNEYGYSGKNKIVSDKDGNEFSVIGFVHTHQSKTNDPDPSFATEGYGDCGSSFKWGPLPIFTLGWDGNVYGCITRSLDPFTITQYQDSKTVTTNKALLNGNFNLRKVMCHLLKLK